MKINTKKSSMMNWKQIHLIKWKYKTEMIVLMGDCTNNAPWPPPGGVFVNAPLPAVTR